MPFLGVFVAGWREGALKKLVAEYKYKSVRACGEVLAELIDARLPSGEELRARGHGEENVVVPLPTIGKHVRARGFDHTLSLAKKLAKRRGWWVERILERRADTVQVGASQAERETQAKRAYGARKEANPKVNYWLVDDVWTTGASMLAAAEVLKEAGAEKIFAVVVETGEPDLEKEVSGIETGK